MHMYLQREHFSAVIYQINMYYKKLRMFYNIQHYLLKDICPFIIIHYCEEQLV